VGCGDISCGYGPFGCLPNYQLEFPSILISSKFCFSLESHEAGEALWRRKGGIEVDDRKLGSSSAESFKEESLLRSSFSSSNH
jgi:hypothetical protein